MNEQNSKSDMAKAWVFFEKARKVAEQGNFDYAIEMYIDGLRYSPDAVLDGHIKLRTLAIARQEKGGKKPAMMEKMKMLTAGRHSPLEQMLNAEYLFSKDTGSASYAESILKAAVAGGFKQTARWIANLLFQMNTSSAKPSFKTFILLKDSYAQVGEFDLALRAIQYAVQLRPEDGELADEYKRLSAELTMVRGKYDEQKSFRESIKDREVQEKQQSQDSVVKTEDFRQAVIREAREEMAKDPNLPKNIFNLAQALSEMEEDNYENEAMQVLEKAYQEKRDFSFKERAGLIKIMQIGRKVREAKAAVELKPQDQQSKANLERLQKLLNEVKRGHYRLCVENYPTNLQVKYEYANALLENKQCDDAIPLFQEAQRDPRHKIPAMGRIGLCFYLKGWYTDAIDVFNQAIEAYELQDDDMAKDLRYNLGRSLEANGEEEKALEFYRKIAQLDFGYKDIRQRVDNLRKKKSSS
jgi:tetratricopeptide (TPR) repeat protein